MLAHNSSYCAGNGPIRQKRTCKLGMGVHGAHQGEALQSRGGSGALPCSGTHRCSPLLLGPPEDRGVHTRFCPTRAAPAGGCSRLCADSRWRWAAPAAAGRPGGSRCWCRRRASRCRRRGLAACPCPRRWPRLTAPRCAVGRCWKADTVWWPADVGGGASGGQTAMQRAAHAGAFPSASAHALLTRSHPNFPPLNGTLLPPPPLPASRSSRCWAPPAPSAPRPWTLWRSTPTSLR